MRQTKTEKPQADTATNEDLAAPAVGYIMRQVERQRYQDCAAFARRALAVAGVSMDAGTLGALYAMWREEQGQTGKEGQ